MDDFLGPYAFEQSISLARELIFLSPCESCSVKSYVGVSYRVAYVPTTVYSGAPRHCGPPNRRWCLYRRVLGQQLLCEPTEPTNQPTNQPVHSPTNPPTNHQPTDQIPPNSLNIRTQRSHTNSSTHQLANHSTNQLTNQPLFLLITNQPSSQPVHGRRGSQRNQPINKASKQATERPVHKLTNQPSNRPTKSNETKQNEAALANVVEANPRTIAGGPPTLAS